MSFPCPTVQLSCNSSDQRHQQLSKNLQPIQFPSLNQSKPSKLQPIIISLSHIIIYYPHLWHHQHPLPEASRAWSPAAKPGPRPGCRCPPCRPRAAAGRSTAPWRCPRSWCTWSRTRRRQPGNICRNTTRAPGSMCPWKLGLNMSQHVSTCLNMSQHLVICLFFVRKRRESITHHDTS